VTTDVTEPPALLAATPEPPPEPQHPHPPRYRRLKRYASLTALFLAAILVLRLWWGREAARRLAAEVEAIHARGEPVLRQDFEPEEVPDAEDAIGAYQRAGASIAITPIQQGFRDRFNEIVPLTDADRRQVKWVLNVNASALQQARAARELTRYRAATLRTPVVRNLRYSRSPSADLAGLLKWRALDAYDTGDDAAAIEALRDIPPVAAAVDRDVPALLQHGASEEIDAIGIRTVFQFAPRLIVESDRGPRVPGRVTVADVTPATRAQLAALIAKLLNDAPMRKGLVLAMWGHRMMAFDGEPAALDALPAPLHWAMRPAMDLNTVRTARQFGQAATAAAEPDFQSARAKLPPDPLAAQNHPSMLEGLSTLRLDWFLERLDGYLLRHYEHLADRRMAAVALAIRFYRADHAGRWPQSLDELVPAYLPSVPADPFAAGGKPLKYLPDTPGWDIPPALAAAESSFIPPPGTGPFIGGPVVYSVGEDGVDDGGSRQLKPRLVRRGRTFSFERTGWRDQVVPLAGNPEARNPGRPEE
jgi:hypothetical protein